MTYKPDLTFFIENDIDVWIKILIFNFFEFEFYRERKFYRVIVIL